jgi:PAS domain S-box-containing protein
MTDPEFEETLSEKDNLERILENVSEGIIAHDRNRHIIFFNRSAEEITGYRRQEVIGKDCEVLYSVLRDSAYKIKQLAESEKDADVKKEWWK